MLPVCEGINAIWSLLFTISCPVGDHIHVKLYYEILWPGKSDVHLFQQEFEENFEVKHTLCHQEIQEDEAIIHNFHLCYHSEQHRMRLLRQHLHLKRRREGRIYLLGALDAKFLQKMDPRRSRPRHSNQIHTELPSILCDFSDLCRCKAEQVADQEDDLDAEYLHVRVHCA